MRSWMTGLVTGVLGVGWWPQLPVLWWCPVLLLSSGIGLLCRRPVALLGSGLSLGMLLGLLHGHGLLERRLQEECVGRMLIIEGTIASLPRRTVMADGTPRQRFEFAIKTLGPRQCAGPGRVLLSYYGPDTLIPGEYWWFAVKLKKPWGLANPGSYNIQAWFAQTGIDAVGSVSGGRAGRITGADTFAGLHHRLRQSISERIDRLPFESDVRAVLRAVSVADKSGIDSQFWSLLQLLGINHLMVISGLHIGLVAGGAYLLGGLALRLRPGGGQLQFALPGLAALALATAYTALAGFSLPTLRALYMLGCFVLAGLAGRRGSAPARLLLAAAAILALNPLAGLGSGFWLSFSAVSALLWFGQWHRPSLAARVAGTHLFMSLVMLPVGSWWFGGASLVSAPANFVMIPLIGFAVVPAALLAALCFLLGWPLEGMLWQLAAWPLQQVLPWARALSEGGQAWMYHPVDAGPLEVAVALAGVALCALPAAGRWRFLGLLMCLPLLLPQGQKERLPAAHTRVTVLDVGQGTAAVIEAGDRVLLYDTGGGDPAGANMARSVILPYLRSRGVRRLDTFVVSHPDLDHAAGTGSILRALPATRQRFGGKLRHMPRGRPCVAGEAWRWPGGQVFQFLSPAREQGLPSNDGSCVLALDTGGGRLLFTGDIEAGRERELVRYWGRGLGADWLFAAHHGSKTSSSYSFLKTAAPDRIVISHGYANRFGHPHPQVLSRLQGVTPEVYSTAALGALRFDFVPGQPLKVEAYRARVRRYWM